MFSKLIAFIFLLTGFYVLSVFVFPDIADHYGNKDINNKIRTIKDQSLDYASWSESPTSLAEKLIQTSKDMVNETEQTIQNTQKIVTEKTEQVQKTADSVQKAYNAIEEAKTNITNLTNLSGATKQ